jgi:5-methylcytosine-specific restriction endonuclease McrA
MAKDTRERVGELLAEGLSLAKVARRLGISKSTACYHKRRLGQPMNLRFARRYDWPAVQIYYDEGNSKRDCQKQFGFSSWAWTYAVKRGAIVPRPQTMPIVELLQAGAKRGRQNLKARLLAAGLKNDQCEECGLTEWRDKPLSMALHHINGDGNDNRLENLVLLCPNCHSQTPNFGVKNWKQRSVDAEAA